MTTYLDLQDFFQSKGYRVIIAADAETRVSTRSLRNKDEIVSRLPVGGVAVALDPIAKAAQAVYIARGKTEEEKKIAQITPKVGITDTDGRYSLRRLFLSKEELDDYYYGFSNQTLWPLCHVAFERPEFNDKWFAGYKKVNQRFANAIKEEIKGKTFIWIHDYQLALVPQMLGKRKDVVIGMFWHIPWPTWEVFRILPQKKEIIESLLNCDFLAFHRGYQVRNFLDTADRELELRIDQETNKVFFQKNTTVVKNLPLGIDTDVISTLASTETENNSILSMIQRLLGEQQVSTKKASSYKELFGEYKVILGVDRLDYTKGLRVRLMAIDQFFTKYPRFKEKVMYVGILAPSREQIPSYMQLGKEIKTLALAINNKYATKKWKPIQLLHDIYPREEVVSFYKNAAVCLVTPLDDGMNLVSKEYIIAASESENPGMLVLSQFAGSAIDLTKAIIVNPYNIEEVSEAIKKALEMPKQEKKEKLKAMAAVLGERNIYAWAQEFVKSTLEAKQ